jgi:microcystin-dependent protein
MSKSTANYGWQMPDPGGSANTWGTTLNGTIQAIDQQVFTNQQFIVPVGSILMYGGAVSPPAGWLFCNGQEVLQSDYPLLYGIIGGAFNTPGTVAGSFNLPNFTNVFPLGGTGAAGGVTGGSFDAQLVADNLPPHTHTATQAAHSHLDTGHTHGVSDPGHAHGSNLVRQGAGSAGLYPAGGFTISGSGNTDGAATGITIGSGSANLQAQAPLITVNPSTGSGSAFDVTPPYLVINFIIKHD